jgi:hypothetical protein
VLMGVEGVAELDARRLLGHLAKPQAGAANGCG